MKTRTPKLSMQTIFMSLPGKPDGGYGKKLIHITKDYISKMQYVAEKINNNKECNQ